MKTLLGVLLSVGLAQSATWSYEGSTGVDFWSSNYPDFCSHNRQSPIDVPVNSGLTHDATMGPFTMTGYTSMAASVIKNNGHTVQVDVGGSLPKLSGGGLTGTYEALQLHFHWGPNSAEGSEHTFRGRKYPLELHVVHKKENVDISTALGQGDGLAVLGFFFVVGDTDNTNLDPLMTAMDNIRFKGQNTSVTFNFSDVMPSDLTEFYRYEGSLTTPSCNEAVIWTVFEDKITISEAQLAKFRQMYENEAGQPNKYMTINYRPAQNLNGRTVKKSYSEDVPSSFHWGYTHHEGPEYWTDYYGTCTGNRQSPVNIPTPTHSNMDLFDASMNLDTLEFRNYNTNFTGVIKNNGHTIQVDIPAGTDLILAEGGLPATYRAAQFHFHWGPDNYHGSEHTFQDTMYPLEMHIVHYRESYGDLSTAVTHTDGLAVVGFFFQVSSESNSEYADIISALTDVKYKGASKAISNVNLLSLTNKYLRLNATVGDSLPFFRYAGGLTTPPCSEVVTWSVMRNTIPLSSAQIAAFREVGKISSGTLATADKIKVNYRPVQSLFTRKVQPSFDYMATLSSGRQVTGNLIAVVGMSLAAVFAMLR